MCFLYTGILIKVETFSFCAASKPTYRVTDYHSQNHGANAGIEPIVLAQKIHHREEHTQDGSQQQSYHTQLNPTASIPSRYTVKDASKGGIVGGMRLILRKVRVVGHGFAAMQAEIHHTAHKGNEASHRHTPSKRSGNELLQICFSRTIFHTSHLLILFRNLR